MSYVTVRLAGTFAVHVDGADVPVGGKARRMLTLLAVDRDRTVPIDRVIETLWADRPPRRPAENVATLVSRLRSTLGPDVVTGGREGYRLGGPPGVRVDLDDAAGLVVEATRRLPDRPSLAASAALRAGELLGSGDVLVGEPDSGWVAQARAEGERLLRDGRHVLARAALDTGDLRRAREAAESAIRADHLDEMAVCLLMAAHRAAGEPHRALAAFERLRTDLATELGVDPAPQTRAAHEALLTERPDPAAPRPVPVIGRHGPVGRTRELEELTSAWERACAGDPSVLLLCGEGGIGKTWLAAEVGAVAEGSGGRVLQARCYAGEHSLALQPFVDALTEPLATLPTDRVRELAGPRGSALAGLIPRLEGALGRDVERGSPELELRRTFEAVVHVLCGLAADRPALLVLDDLHNAGLATVEMLHFLARHMGRARLLVLVTVRAEEGEAALGTLGELTGRLDVGPLDPDAVADLAVRAGHAARATDIHRRTRGHTLFVVETLRGLSAGDSGTPDSLQSAVLARLRRTGPATAEVLRAAAVLGATVDPATVAGLLDVPLLHVAQRCELAARARLLVPTDTTYEFANDLIQEVLYATTPVPTRLAHHTRAADLLDHVPEAAARHALATGDLPRVCEALLRAADEALARFAAADAEELSGRALTAAEENGDRRLVARASLARGRSRLVRARFGEAFADQRAALDAAREAGDRATEMAALRELGGHAALSGDYASITECTGWLDEALRIAEQREDDRARAGVLGWLGIVASNRLRFSDATDYAHRAVEAARAAGDDHALAAGLDGLKNAHAYLGEARPLQVVLDELEPLLRRLGDLELLQWTVFESAFPAVAAGDWAAAERRCEEAVRINRRGGPVLHDSWFLAFHGRLARLQGRDDDALDLGRQALELTERSPHRWFGPYAAAQLATTMLELGRSHEAARLLAGRRRHAERTGAEANLLRCLAPLAEASGSPEVLAEADALLGGIDAPAGAAWLLGTDCYLSVARSWSNVGRPGRARVVLAPLLAAADRHGWLPAQVAGALVDGRAAAADGDPDAARTALGRATELGRRHGMPALAREAQAALEVVGGPVGRTTTDRHRTA